MGLLDSTLSATGLDDALGMLSGAAAADAAAQAGLAGTQAGIAETRRQFDITQEQLAPFLEAGTGALGTYQEGIGGGPQAPTLAQFSFDPTQALQSPALQFQREMGEQQLDRLAARNRNLTSGNRLLDAVRFGQGLASQSLGEEYGRQLGTYDVNRATQMQNYGMASDRYNQRMDRLAGLIDVGRGTGSALGALGAGASSNIANLMQTGGQIQGAAELAKHQGLMNVLGMGVQGLGMAMGIPPVGGLGGGGIGGGGLSVPSIGFNPSSQGFF